MKTLFEEGWGEVDHHIRYLNRTNDKLLNRVSGLGDEMASFYNRLECVPSSEFITRKEQLENGTEILKPQPKDNSVAADSETMDQMIAAVVSE